MSDADSSQPPFRPEIARRVRQLPGAPAFLIANDPPEAKKLIVGRDISLSGEIATCDKLIIEGRVEATLSDAKSIEIAPGGYFKGSAEVDEADFSGTFEGVLRVSGRLVVRATGIVSGEVQYGEIEIEYGGEICGSVVKAPAVGGTAAPTRGAVEV